MYYFQGRSKRSGWSGHGRTNNRAGKFNLIFLFSYIFYFFGRNNNRAGIFLSILFLKQRRHSCQNVHPGDSILGRFRPSHAGSHNHDPMGGKGPHGA